MASEVRGTVQGTAGGRAEEWNMAEPSGEDQPETTLSPEGSENDLSRFGRYIGLSALPGDREALLKSAQDLGAPDDIVEMLGRLPADTTYQNVAEAWRAVTR
jgi:hypothetical protein